MCFVVDKKAPQYLTMYIYTHRCTCIYNVHVLIYTDVLALYMYIQFLSQFNDDDHLSL